MRIIYLDMFFLSSGFSGTFDTGIGVGDNNSDLVGVVIVCIGDRDILIGVIGILGL